MVVMSVPLYRLVRNFVVSAINMSVRFAWKECHGKECLSRLICVGSHLKWAELFLILVGISLQWQLGQ